MPSPPTLLVFDLSNLVFRAYFALPKLTTSRGEPTGAVMGVVRMVRKVIRERSPAAVAVAMDSPIPVHRKEVFEGYKANRPPAPGDLKDQIPVIEDLLGLMGLSSFTVPGWEADDVIATLTRKARAAGYSVEIVSADKDLAQLVGDGVVLIADEPGSRATRIVDARAVQERWGVPPGLMLDLLALTGDASDNVPGVHKVGPKTAVKLITEHGGLDAILTAAHGMKAGKLRDTLLEHRDDAVLSRELVRLVDDLPLTVDFEDLAPGAVPDVAKLVDRLERLELREVMSDLAATTGGDDVAVTPAGKGKDYALVLDLGELEREVARIREAGALSVDLETTSVDPTRAQIVGVSISCQPDRGRYVAVGHRYMGAPAQPRLDQVLGILEPVLVDPAVRVYGQNVKYEDAIFTRHGIRMQGIDFDTMIASYLLDPERHQHRLEQIASDRLGYRMITYDEVTRKHRGSQMCFDEVPVDEAARYSAEDAEIVWSLVPRMREEMERAGLDGLMRDLELPLSRVLADMELTGVALDAGYLGKLESGFETQLVELERRAHAIAGRPFNLASPRQLQTVLFEELGLVPGRKTKTGYSTDSETLLELSMQHELPAVVLEHRGLAKLLSTYVRALPLAVNPQTGRVHTSFNQAVAATGRLSSSEPNLQNIPVRSENGRMIRAAFRPSEGRVLMSADYSQIELRVLAHLSADPDLVDAFRSGQDVHVRTASQVFGVPLAGVDHEMRSRAKAINFGVIYGQTDYGLSQQLKIPRKQAREFIETYFKRYAGVKTYMERVVEQARTGEGVKTMLGRRRFFRNIASRNHAERSNAERMARNTPIQGTAADIMKLAMVRVHRGLTRGGFNTRMVLTVHDELVFDVPQEEVDEARRLVTELMQGALVLIVPLVVDLGLGTNWGEAHP